LIFARGAATIKPTAEGTMEAFDYILFTVTGALLLYELAEYGRGRSNLFSKMREWFFPKKK